MLKSRTRQDWSPSALFFFNIILEALAGARRQENEIKKIQRQTEIKLSLYADDIVSNPPKFF